MTPRDLADTQKIVRIKRLEAENARLRERLAEVNDHLDMALEKIRTLEGEAK